MVALLLRAQGFTLTLISYVSPMQALPVKLLALGAFTGVVNLPSGVARVHVEKFSPGWFVAVSLAASFNYTG